MTLAARSSAELTNASVVAVEPDAVRLWLMNLSSLSKYFHVGAKVCMIVAAAPFLFKKSGDIQINRLD